MRNVLASAVLGMLLMTSSGAGAAPLVAAAGTTTTTTTTASPQHRWHMPTVEERVKHMTATLELTPAQIPQVTALLQQADAQRKQRMEKFAASMKAILTPDQQAKIEQMRQQWSQKKDEGPKGDGHKQEGRRGNWGHRPHLDLGLTPQQQIQMHVLRNQSMHLMKADRENLLAQMSGVLTPLQEKAYEQTSRRMSHRFSGHQGGGHWQKGNFHKDGHRGPHADTDEAPTTVGDDGPDAE